LKDVKEGEIMLQAMVLFVLAGIAEIGGVQGSQ